MESGIGSAQLGDEIIPGLALTSGYLELMAEAEELANDCAPDIRNDGGRRSFLEWLQRPAVNTSTRLPRYLEAIWRERDDCQRRFPEVSVGYLDRFGRWLRNVGRVEHSSVRLLGHEVPPEIPVSQVSRLNHGIDVVGFFTAEHGVGESARLTVGALRAAGVAVSTVNYKDTRSRRDHSFEVDDVGRYNTALFAMNAEQLHVSKPRLGDELFRDKHIIGQWYWELEQTPDWYAKSFPLVNELWAPTHFIESSLRKSVPRHVKVTYMSTAIVKPDIDEAACRSDFGFDDRFMFYFSFDFMSVMKRKNPVGLIHAYCSAFPETGRTQLVIKAMNGNLRPAELSQLMSEAAKRDDIHIIDKVLDRTQTNSLMNLADCYVSLHRSEGLGLTIAEAMALGVPVVATGYSGNLDFMGADHPGLVKWSRVQVGESAEGYAPSATWAEPDPDHAAALMRQVFEEPSRAKQDATQRQTRLLREFGVTMVGERMKARLEEIWSTRRG